MYSRDEDITEISYKFYNQEDESFYPTITICVDDPFKSKELGAYGVNKTNYKNFLRGQLLENRMLQINFESVIIDQYFLGEDIKDYI